MEKVEFCSVEFKDIKAEDDEKTGAIEGYASTFGNIDLGGDKIVKGAFRKTLKENKGKFPILSNHDTWNQIGWNIEAKEDDHGLFVKGELDIENNLDAKRHYGTIRKALEIGAKAGLSIGFRALKWAMDKEDDGSDAVFRVIKEIKLYEYSPVAFPMNTEAMATAAKHWKEITQDFGTDENDVIEKVVAQMQKNGFNELSIKTALEKAAAQFNKPDDLVHLLEQGIQNTKIVMSL